MGRKKSGLDKRILASADGLFYMKGYTNTGINELVQEAGTNKPGLYSYFESKDEVARRYLTARNESIVDSINRIGERSSGVIDFFRSWMDFVKDHVRGEYGPYNGCAVANFALQTDAADAAMQEFIHKTGQRWQSQLVAYIRSQMKAGKFPRKPGAVTVARQMLICHEGAITMWKLTGDSRHFDAAVAMFEAALRGSKEDGG